MSVSRQTLPRADRLRLLMFSLTNANFDKIELKTTPLASSPPQAQANPGCLHHPYLLNYRNQEKPFGFRISGP